MDLSTVPTETLLAELAARGGAVHPDDASVPARAMIVTLCAETGIPAPAPDATLAEWADEVLNSPLAPRGGPAWREGHLHILDALEAALAGSAPVCRQSLADARAVVAARGNDFCTCSPSPPLSPDHYSGRPLCTRCRQRRR